MEKRSSQLTVMLEPSIHELLRQNYDQISVLVHDLIVSFLIQEHLLPDPVKDSNEEMIASDLAYDAAREKGKLM